MKLENGSMVKVKENLLVDEFYNGLRFHNGMNKHKGKIAIIKGTTHYNDQAYQLDIDTEGYDWSTGMFERI